MSDPAPRNESELWCRGCRGVAVRALTPEERAWLASLRARHVRRAVLGACVFPAGALGLATLVWYAPEGHAWIEGVTAVSGILTLLLGLPVSLLLTRDHAKAARELGRDLAADEAWVFEPPPAEAEPDEPALASGDDVVRGRAAAGVVAGPPPFAVLPHSRRVVDVSVRALGVPRADVIEAEPFTGSGWYAPLSLVATGPGPQPAFQQRAMSGGERAELERLSAQLLRPRFATLFGVCGLAVIAAALLHRAQQPASGPPTELFSAGLWAVFCARYVGRYFRGLQLSVRMRRDLDTGLVVQADDRPAGGSEFLPFSRLLWRASGAPAGWRDRRRAVARLLADL